MGGKRGAQPGNNHHHKRGSNSRRFWEGEQLDFEAMLIDSLVEDKAGLRLFERRVMALDKGMPSLEEWINLAGALGLVAMRLAGAIRIQRQVYGGDPEFAARLAQAFDEFVHCYAEHLAFEATLKPGEISQEEVPLLEALAEACCRMTELFGRMQSAGIESEELRAQLSRGLKEAGEQ